MQQLWPCWHTEPRTCAAAASGLGGSIQAADVDVVSQWLLSAVDLLACVWCDPAICPQLLAERYGITDPELIVFDPWSLNGTPEEYKGRRLMQVGQTGSLGAAGVRLPCVCAGVRGAPRWFWGSSTACGFGSSTGCDFDEGGQGGGSMSPGTVTALDRLGALAAAAHTRAWLRHVFLLCCLLACCHVWCLSVCMQGFLYVRSCKADNEYAHPLDLCPLVDLNLGKVGGRAVCGGGVCV